MVRVCQTVLDNSTSDIDRARLLAAKAVRGSAWSLLCRFLPAVFVLVTRLLGSQSVFARLNLCESHSGYCGGAVYARNIHGLSCKRSAGRSICHQQINDLVWRALRKADSPSVKEPSGFLPVRTSALPADTSAMAVVAISVEALVFIVIGRSCSEGCGFDSHYRSGSFLRFNYRPIMYTRLVHWY